MAASRLPITLACVAFALGCSACEKGCLATWLANRSASPAAGGEDPRGSGKRDAQAAAVDLSGTDCSDGLARCAGGHVEVSLLGHAQHAECPWEPRDACEHGCVADGLEVVATADVAHAQLCRPSPADPVVRPVLPAEAAAVSICADEDVSCRDGVIRVCAARGQPARLVAACLNGCASGIAIEPGDLGTGDGRAAILCRRAHAERR